VLAEVVLREPRRGEAALFGLHDLLDREAVAVGGGRLFEEATEVAETGAAHAGTSSLRGDGRE
jgi:hypothetical protein